MEKITLSERLEKTNKALKNKEVILSIVNV